MGANDLSLARVNFKTILRNNRNEQSVNALTFSLWIDISLLILMVSRTLCQRNSTSQRCDCVS